jgi:hypothetical protein
VLPPKPDHRISGRGNQPIRSHGLPKRYIAGCCFIAAAGDIRSAGDAVVLLLLAGVIVNEQEQQHSRRSCWQELLL